MDSLASAGLQTHVTHLPSTFIIAGSAALAIAVGLEVATTSMMTSLDVKEFQQQLQTVSLPLRYFSIRTIVDNGCKLIQKIIVKPLTM